MASEDRTNKQCILGAGSSGLVMAKWCRQRGIPFDVLERKDEVGGNWHFNTEGSSVCQSTHLLSSKGQTAFVDFPMPDDYPDYPSHRLVFEYLKSYARHFALYPTIEFRRTVERIERVDDQWEIRLDGGETRRYGGLVIANGHNWDPKFPDYPGRFEGQILHSCQYKTPDVLRGRRVLVVGAGNSGCDIAVDSAQNAAATFHSTRRGYHYFPKYLFGVPADVLNERMLRLRVPLWVRRLSLSFLTKMVLGSPQDYGLKKPDHRVLETHPIVNSQMLYYVGHGDIVPKPDVQEFEADAVRFADGSREKIDVVIYATGFKISFPFLDAAHVDLRDGKPDLYLHVFSRRYDNLFVLGLIQPDSGQFGLVDHQAQAVARFIEARAKHSAAAEQFRRQKAADRPDLSNGIQYVDSTRHILEIEHFTYRRRLTKIAASLA